MVDEADPIDTANAAVVLATALKEDKRKQKFEQLKSEAKAAKHKALQSKRLLEEESGKRKAGKNKGYSKFLLHNTLNC